MHGMPRGCHFIKINVVGGVFSCRSFFSLFFFPSLRQNSLSSCIAIKIKRFYVYFHIVWPNNVILNVTFGMNFIPCNDFEWQNIWIKKTTPESIQILRNFFFTFTFLIVSENLSLKIDISRKCRKHQEQQTMCYCGMTN